MRHSSAIPRAVRGGAIEGAAAPPPPPRPTRSRRGATDAGTKIGWAGTGTKPVPRVRSTGGGDGCRWDAPISFGRTPAHAHRRGTRPSGAAERQRDEPRALPGFHPQQNGALAAGAGIAERITHVRQGGNDLAANVEDDIAGLDPMLGRRTIGEDFGDDHALAPGSCPVAGRRNRHAEARQRRSRHLAFLWPRPRLALFRQLAESERERLLLALAQDGEFDGAARRDPSDPLGEVARILDGLAIHGGYHVARLDAGFGGWTIGLRLGDERTLGGFETEALGDFGGHRLDLHADPTASHRALLLELVDDGPHGV